MADLLHDRVVAALKDQYEVEREIGRGGMSVVYRARDLRLNRTVAVKVLPPELAYDTSVRTRFTREAQTSAQLTHANIIPIYDVGEREGIAYLVMAFITGGNLAALLTQEPRQPIAETRRMLCEIADALAYAHQRGVVHRDIKPDNILLEGDSGRAIVTDFGIARAMEAGARLTATGNAVGTPAYMSPEQAVGEREIDGRSDIYSLGVVAYQMLTGRLPFTAGNSMALLMKHVSERPRPIGELRPDAPRALREAIERALMKEPDDRWPTGTALRDAITAGEGAVARRSQHREPEPRERETQEPEPREPVDLTALTPAQREDLKLWHGRIDLMERVKLIRLYLPFTGLMWILGMAGFAAGVDEIPPMVLAPIIPALVTRKLWRRGVSLKARGLKLLRVFFMPRAKWVIPAPAPAPGAVNLAKLAPRAILEGPHGAVIRRAADDRAAILDIVAQLSKPDRALLPDVVPTVNALVERVVHLAQALDRLEESIDPRLVRDLDARIADVERGGASPDGERRLALLKRQRDTIEELVQRRVALERQLDSAGLALGNIRLDLVKFRSSGLQSAMSDVSTATQEARALSREIGNVLDAADEVRNL